MICTILRRYLHGDRKFHPRTGVRCEQLLADRYVQQAPKHPKLLVHRRRLERTLFPIATIEPHANPLFQPIAKVFFDCVGCELHQFLLAKAAFRWVMQRMFTAWVLAARVGGFEKFLRNESAHSPKLKASPLRITSRRLPSLA